MTVSPVYASSSHSFMVLLLLPRPAGSDRAAVCERRWRQGPEQSWPQGQRALLVDVTYKPQTHLPSEQTAERSA